MNTTAWVIAVPVEATHAAWVAMRHCLWPQTSEAGHQVEARAWIEQGNFIRLAIHPDGRVAGFAEAAMRADYVNGCETSPVAFLEGIYVEPWGRRQGAARALVKAAEHWALERGCREFASDALLENEMSHLMHRALGFAETERVVFFRRWLG